MAFGMMAPMGKPDMKGKPAQTKGGKNAVPPSKDKMPGAKQAMEYTKKAAPSDAGMRSVKALPAKKKGQFPMKKGAK